MTRVGEGELTGEDCSMFSPVVLVGIGGPFGSFFTLLGDTGVVRGISNGFSKNLGNQP